MTAINRPDRPDFDDGDARLIEVLGNQAAIAIENADLFARVEQMAHLDVLTGINNRRRFFSLAHDHVQQAIAHGENVAALFLDVDHFKHVNDTYGHAVGDQVLTILAQRIQSGLRQTDIFGRYGGEEFVVLLPGVTDQQAYATAERLRRRIEEKPVTLDARQISVTISVGVASLGAGLADLPALISAADSALYLSKQQGRNRTSLWAGAGRQWFGPPGVSFAPRRAESAAIAPVSPSI